MEQITVGITESKLVLNDIVYAWEMGQLGGCPFSIFGFVDFVMI